MKNSNLSHQSNHERVIMMTMIYCMWYRRGEDQGTRGLKLLALSASNHMPRYESRIKTCLANTEHKRIEYRLVLH